MYAELNYARIGWKESILDVKDQPVINPVTGFVLLGFFTDLFAPFVAPLAHADLMLPAMWGGIITGIGYGMVLRAGANTGGSDTIGQIISRNTSLPVGSTVMAIDVAV